LHICCEFNFFSSVWIKVSDHILQSAALLAQF
jgi:hypothetical protein